MPPFTFTVPLAVDPAALAEGLREALERSGKVGIAVCMADTEGMNAEKANIEAFFKSIKPVK